MSASRSGVERPRKPLRIEHVGPQRLAALADFADLAFYLGSPEHKNHPNPINGTPAALHSDKTRCPVYPASEWCRFTTLLRHAIRHGAVAGEDGDGGPRHVWGWCDGRVFEARRLSAPQHAYKAWFLEDHQHPHDPKGVLEQLRKSLSTAAEPPR